MRITKLLLENYRFLKNRDRIFFANKREAFKDLYKTTGGVIVVIAGFFGLLKEFAFPTPDMIYDLQKRISPDFALYCEHGDLAEYNVAVSSSIYGTQLEAKREEIRKLKATPAESRIGGAY